MLSCDYKEKGLDIEIKMCEANKDKITETINDNICCYNDPRESKTNQNL